MSKQDIIKYGLAGIGVFTCMVAANITSEAIYTKNKIGIDGTAAIAGAAVGFLTSVIFIKALK
jgi:hypothetical protein